MLLGRYLRLGLGPLQETDSANQDFIFNLCSWYETLQLEID